ncbi:MAG: hypothetical protein ACFB9N_17610 [Geitlerinemataceae cyanobacterium]
MALLATAFHLGNVRWLRQKKPRERCMVEGKRAGFGCAWIFSVASVSILPFTVLSFVTLYDFCPSTE